MPVPKDIDFAVPTGRPMYMQRQEKQVAIAPNVTRPLRNVNWPSGLFLEILVLIGPEYRVPRAVIKRLLR